MRASLVPILAAALGSVIAADPPSLVSVASDGGGADGASWAPLIAAGGRYVVFTSAATNLVPGDTNGLADVFVRDLVAGTTERVSVGGGQADGASEGRGISADGRYVLFESLAGNLVPGDTNGQNDAFIRDCVAGTTTRVSLSRGGAQLATGIWHSRISADASTVVFETSDPAFIAEIGNAIIARDRVSGAVERIDVATDGTPQPGGGWFWDPVLSSDGRRIAFLGRSDHLAGPPTAPGPSVYLRDRDAGTTTLVPVPWESGGAVHSDFSGAADLLLSGDGNVVAFITDTVVGPGYPTLIVRDLTTGTERRDIPDTYGRSHPRNYRLGALSADGGRVGFWSDGGFTEGDTQAIDAFVHDAARRGTLRLSRPSSGALVDGDSEEVSLTADGSVAAFSSMASNLVAADANGQRDVFIADSSANIDPVLVHRSYVERTAPAGTTSITLSAADFDLGSYDPEGQPLNLSLTPSSFGPGYTEAVLAASDGVLTTTAVVGVQLTVEIPLPAVTCAVETAALWPADGSIVDVGLSLTPSMGADIVSVSVTQDERVFDPRARDPGSDAVLLRDAQGAVTGLRLRAERVQSGDGRVYLVLVTVRDAQGRTATGACSVVVPSDGSTLARAAAAAQAAEATATLAPLAYDSTALPVFTQRLLDPARPLVPSGDAVVSRDGDIVAYTVSRYIGSTLADALVVLDRSSGRTVDVTAPGDGIGARMPVLSDDGRFLLYHAYRVDDYRESLRIWDRRTRSSRIVATAQPMARFHQFTISGDGSAIAFTTDDPAFHGGVWDNQPHLFVADSHGRHLVQIDVSPSGEMGEFGAAQPFLDRDGSAITFISSSTNLRGGGDLNGLVYRRDLRSGAIEVLSRVAGIDMANCNELSVSSDGAVVAFVSPMRALPDDDLSSPDAYVLDRRTGDVRRIGRFSDRVALSGDGRHLAIGVWGSQLTAWPWDQRGVQVADLADGTVRLLSIGFDGRVPDSGCGLGRGARRLVDGGRTVVFGSSATNLVPADPAPSWYGFGAAYIATLDVAPLTVAAARPVVRIADRDGVARVPALAFDAGSFSAGRNGLRLRVTPPGPYPVGETAVTLTVSDGRHSDWAVTAVTVEPAEPAGDG